MNSSTKDEVSSGNYNALNESSVERDLQSFYNRTLIDSSSRSQNVIKSTLPPISSDEAAAMLAVLYRDYLGRSPDSSGLAWFTNMLVTGQTTPSAIATAIASSPEGIEYTISLESIIQNIFWDELGRVADVSGLAFFVGQIRRGITAAYIRSDIRKTQESIIYRAGRPAPSPDPRLPALRTFNADGNSVIDFRAGDTLQSLAKLAYGDSDLWWVVAQANNAMSNKELASLRTLLIPSFSGYGNPNIIQIGDNGYAAIYVNRITGWQFDVQYVPISSQLEPIVFEENPNWLNGLAFVNGNDVWNRVDFQISRSQPYPLMSPGFWLSQKGAVDVPLEEISIPLNIDTRLLQQLPVYNGAGTAVNPPPPVVTSTPGANPAVAIDAMEKYPSQILNTVRISGIKVIAVKRTIVEAFKDLDRQPLPEWGEGYTWNDVPGGFYEHYNAIVVATDADMKAHGSEALFDHEFAHAYDHAMGTLSLSPSFEAAFKADFKALEKESPDVKYYTALDKNRTYVRAQRETYAESFANYYTGKAKWFQDKPALLNYFRNLPRPVQPR